MGRGKRRPRAGLTGLSQFVLDAFKQDSQPAPAEPTPEKFPQSKIKDPEVDSEEPPAKRLKTSRSGLVDPSGETGDGLLDQGTTWAEQWVEKYDATGLVPHYTDTSQVPEHLQKYFSQRFRFFSLYSSPPGCLLDEEGWYSVTPELIADQIAERCRCDTILDAFCGVGGNAIAFARTCQRVIALDTSSTRLSLARHNAQIYGVANRIEFILTDYISFANSYISSQHHPNPTTTTTTTTSPSRKIDVVFLSPPWGGPSYLSGTTIDSNTPSSEGSNAADVFPNNLAQTLTSGLNPSSTTTPTEKTHPSYSLTAIRPINGVELFRLGRQITQNVAYYLPRNTKLEEISDLLKITTISPSNTEDGVVENKGENRGKGNGKKKEMEVEMIEVEEEWMGSKLKALTCYFGGLTAGQEALF